MELRRVEKNDYQYVKALYTEAFPSEERAPFWLLAKRAKQCRGDFWLICDGKISIGLAYVVTDNGLAYVFYYAIEKALRGKGYGTAALKSIIEKYKKYRLFLALENWCEDCENKQQRIKRHECYLNCNLHDLPYKLKEARVIYAIMGTCSIVEPCEYKAMMNRFVGFPIKYFVDMRIIKN